MASLTAKQALESKTNWVALALLILGFVTDPQVMSFIPESYAPLILKIAGPVIFVLKTFFSKQVPDGNRPLVSG